jgi:hypothetical protein
MRAALEYRLEGRRQGYQGTLDNYGTHKHPNVKRWLTKHR